MVAGAKRGAPAASSQGELGGEANRASAIHPPRVRGLLTSGPLDRLSSSRGIPERSLSSPSAAGPTYVGPGGRLVLEAPRSVAKWGVYVGNRVNSQSAGR